jgi:deoxyribose-phosphate aldolase
MRCCRLKSPDNSPRSAQSAALSSTASSSASLLDRSDPNHIARPRRSNPHGPLRHATRSHSRGFLPWRLSDAGRPNTPRRLSCGRHPKPFIEALGFAGRELHTGAVCVYHRFVATAAEALDGSAIPVAAVSTGFPAGLVPHDLKLREIEASVRDGAQEIDIVITREHVLTGDWRALYAEVRDFRAACGNAHLKTILATGDLKTLRNVAKASMVCMMAGADFIKTSTGKEGVNATQPVTLAMLRMIRVYQERTGYRIGFKPAGGISTAKDVLNYQFLMKEELGRDWLEPALFRIGASSLLADIERQLEHHVTGRYSAFNRHPVG